MQLAFYSMVWLGEIKGIRTYYAFRFEAKDSNYNHYKSLMLGSDVEKYAKQWFSYLKMAYSKI